jgi:competence protein ComFB
MHTLHSVEKPLNVVKVLAEELVSSVMERVGLEDTEENREDILAITLNQLPTKYVTTDEGKQYSQLINVYRGQYEADVVAGLTKATLIVKGKPRGKDV